MLGNTLEIFLEADFSFLETGICYLGKVPVLLDMHNGLAEDIVIKKGEIVPAFRLCRVSLSVKSMSLLWSFVSPLSFTIFEEIIIYYPQVQTCLTSQEI